MKFEELKKQLLSLYDDFFTDMNIDKKTGIVHNTNLRFSGYPYIGRNYDNAPIKILFIPYDCGEDECRNENTFHTFESREDIFPDGMLDFNAHIAGTYATALYILKDVMNLQHSWEALWNMREKFKTAKAIKECYSDLPKDLMSYIAYENRFRFVTIGRCERSGDKDRVWINAARESQMLVDEICALSPDVIVFHGKQGIDNCRVPELKEKYKVVVMDHPSSWRNGGDTLQYIVNVMQKQLDV